MCYAQDSLWQTPSVTQYPTYNRARKINPWGTHTLICNLYVLIFVKLQQNKDGRNKLILPESAVGPIIHGAISSFLDAFCTAIIYDVFFLLFITFRSNERYWTWFHIYSCVNIALHTRSIVTAVTQHVIVSCFTVSYKIINLLTVWAFIQTVNKLITDSETRDDNVPCDSGNNRPSVKHDIHTRVLWNQVQ